MFKKCKLEPEPQPIPCPYCGTLMTFGYIHAGPPVAWNRKKRLTALPQAEIIIHRNRFTGVHIPSFFCKNCEIFIFEKT